MSRKEEIRHAALAYLAARPKIAASADAVRRNLNRDGGDYTESETTEALELLTGLDLASSEPDPLGSTRYYKITSAGVLAFERAQ